MSEQTPSFKLAAGRLMACEQFPYFASAIVSMTPTKVPEGTLGTFGITNTGVLIVDDAPLRRWDVPQTCGVIVHEALHVLRDHCKRCESIDGHPVVWNLAADAEINDDLHDANLTLPGSPVMPSTFGLEEGRTAEEYYAELMKKAKACPKCGGIRLDGEAQQGDDGCSADGDRRRKDKDKGKGKRKKADGCPNCAGPSSPSAGGGWCGSGAGRPLPNEPKMRGQVERVARSEAELASLRKRTAEAMIEHAQKHQGTVPGGLLRWAEGFLKPPKVNWRQKLAAVARHAVDYRPGAVDFKYTRPSRRQGAVGYGHGRPILPALRRPVPVVAVAVDTSGSMSTADLERAVAESDGILRAVGADVHFIACDAAVGAVKRMSTARELARSLVGGGGTDFAPVFHALAELRPLPEVLVFVTDGYGPAPAEPPRMTRVIWVLVGEQATEPHFAGHPFGEFIRVDNEAA